MGFRYPPDIQISTQNSLILTGEANGFDFGFDPEGLLFELESFELLEDSP